MRTLWILRHAKAVPHSPHDHGRRLAPRGRRQCEEVAVQLAEMKQPPTLVLSSSATRALETAERVLPGLGPGAEVVVEPGLYQADADDVIDLVRQVDDARSEVMVVGHNPTVYELALMLLDPGDTDGYKQVEPGLTTAALAVISFEADRWEQVAARHGHLEELFVPKSR